MGEGPTSSEKTSRTGESITGWASFLSALLSSEWTDWRSMDDLTPEHSGIIVCLLDGNLFIDLEHF